MASISDFFPKHLSTPRLTLELFNHSPEHYTTLLTAMNSPTAHKYMGDFGIRTPKQFDSFNSIARLQDPRFKNGVADTDLYYLIRLGSSNPQGELIGGVSISQRTAKSGDGKIVLPPDFGWCVVEGHMGMGYATEAARKFLRVAKERFGLKAVMAFASEHNPASNRVAEKLGFVDGGECPDLDHPGESLHLLILPGMQRIDKQVKDGLGFTLQ